MSLNVEVRHYYHRVASSPNIVEATRLQSNAHSLVAVQHRVVVIIVVVVITGYPVQALLRVDGGGHCCCDHTFNGSWLGREKKLREGKNLGERWQVGFVGNFLILLCRGEKLSFNPRRTWAGR